MIKIPSLPFACSIAGGEHHAGLRLVNDAVFNLYYLAKLHKKHKQDVPYLITDNLSKELSCYVDGAHRDLAVVMFHRLLESNEHGIISTPITDKDKKRSMATVAYHFDGEEGLMSITVSFMNASADCPTLAFNVQLIPGQCSLMIDFSADMSIPVMFKDGSSLKQMEDKAWHWVKYICAFNAMLIYKCIGYRLFLYDAMLKKKDVCFNPNYVRICLVSLDGDDKIKL